MKEIKLTKGMVAIVDDSFEHLSNFKWCASKCGNSYYAVRRVNSKKVYLHKEIMNAENRVIIDHINGNSLDNRIENLRACTRRENNFNKIANGSKLLKTKGTFFNKKNNNYNASIHSNGKKIHLGTFNCETAAAVAYNLKAKELFGEYACLNFGGRF